MASKKSRPRGRAMTGGGAGFIFPAFGVALTEGAAIWVNASSETPVGGELLTVPDDATITLLDDDAGKFQLDGFTLETTDTALETGDGPTQPITIRVLWGGRTQDFVLAIPVYDPTEVDCSSTTVSHTATIGTTIGTLSTDVDGSVFGEGLSFSVSDQGGGHFAVSDNTTLKVGGSTNTAGTYDLQIDVLVNGDTVGTFPLTITVT